MYSLNYHPLISATAMFYPGSLIPESGSSLFIGMAIPLLVVVFMHYFPASGLGFCFTYPISPLAQLADTSTYLVSNTSICTTSSWMGFLLWLWLFLLLWSIEVFSTFIQCLGSHHLWILPQTGIVQRHWPLNDDSWWIRRFLGILRLSWMSWC